MVSLARSAASTSLLVMSLQIAEGRVLCAVSRMQRSPSVRLLVSLACGGRHGSDSAVRCELRMVDGSQADSASTERWRRAGYILYLAYKEKRRWLVSWSVVYLSTAVSLTLLTWWR